MARFTTEPKTMWWLPKSHWPSSLKYHLINPYILSCIGLLLGVRVTKCFWDTITERIDFFALGQDGWKLTCWKVFTRIYVEFGVKSFFCFASPFLIHLALFQRNVVKTILSLRFLQPIVVFLPFNLSTELVNGQFDVSQGLINLATFAHLCNVTAAQIRDEATFFIINGLLCHFHAKNIFAAKNYHCVVALTSFSLYFTYLFPINYFDLLYRCVVHLGQWELIQPATQQPNNIPLQQQRFGVRIQQNEQHNENYESFNETSSLPYQDGTRLLFRGNLYIARSHPHYRTVCAEPGNKWHLQLYKIAKNPVALVSYMCIFQCALVAFEFWLLLLTNDWQQIVTLVLLMRKDPESGTIVLAQFYSLDVAEVGNNVSTYEDRNRIQRVILIPGSSVQSVQLLEEEGNEQVVGTVTGDGRICGAVKNTAKLREKIERMFWTYGETADGSNGKRTLSETLRIFDDEKPHVLTRTAGEESVVKGSTTLIVVKGGMTIYPPYGKNDIFGGAIATKELYQRLIDTFNGFAAHSPPILHNVAIR
uniref:Uncharacterized protein n=1 Tax=Globodera rostochiensis TaxID=31243 RepID=A0A914HZ98_GLORO